MKKCSSCESKEKPCLSCYLKDQGFLTKDDVNGNGDTRTDKGDFREHDREGTKRIALTDVLEHFSSDKCTDANCVIHKKAQEVEEKAIEETIEAML